MKTIHILVLLCINSLITYAQIDEKAINYLNDVQFDLSKTFIDECNITSIQVNKDTIPNKVFITSKNALSEFIPLNEHLKEIQAKQKGSNSIIMINNKLIKSIKGVLIDKSFILNVEVISLKEFDYIDYKFSELKMIKINLRSSEKLFLK